MPGGSNYNNWRSGLPPIDSLTLQNSFTIPHSHSNSSDESDSGLRSTGVHGPSHGHPGGLNSPPQFGQVLGAPEQFDDPPFVPHRAAPTVSHRNVHDVHIYSYEGGKASPAESHHSVQSSWSNSSSSSGQSRHDLTRQDSYNSSQHYNQPGPYPQAFQHQPSYQEHYPAYRGPHRIGLEHGQYGDQPSAVGGGGYYRMQSQSYPDNGTLAPEVFQDAAHAQGIPVPSQLSQSTSSQHSSTSSSPISASGSHQGYSGSTQTFSASPNAIYGPAPSVYPDAGPYLRQQLGLSPHEPVSLYSLPDPPQGEKPNQPYPTLIKLAIYGSPRKQLTLQEIYMALEARFEWFQVRKNDKAWKNSIRHNLSLNKVFRHVPRPITEPGKGSYWQLDVSEGEGYKRLRKRRNKNAKATAGSEDDDDEEMSEAEEEGGSPPDASPFAYGPGRNSSSTMDETNIDPELRGEGHVVGERRSRPVSRRTGTNGPYPSSGSSQSPRYGQGQLPPMSDTRSSNQDPSYASPAPVDPTKFGQPCFGQSSFGQPTFNQAPARGAAAPAAFMSSSVSPLAPAAGSSSRVPRPAIGHDRNAPIVQAPPRPGIEYVQNEHGLPSARRVPAQSAPRPSTAYQGYHSSQESTPSATSRVPNWEDSRYYASRPK